MIEYIQQKSAEIRGQDAWGAGHFGAPRGKRVHEGLDLLIPAGSALVSPIFGRIHRIGYPYANDLSFRIVEIRAETRDLWRFFYVKPLDIFKEPGVVIARGHFLGTVQDLSKRFPAEEGREAMPNHVHLEIIRDGVEIDPLPVLKGLQGLTTAKPYRSKKR